MPISLQILSCDTLDSKACVVLSTDSARYLFDVGEGTQRLCFEHKVRLGKIDAIFLTRNDSSVMGGLPGLCLTAADAGKSSMTVVGPKGIEAYWKMISIFAYRPSFSVVMDEISPDQLSDRVFDKGDISILPIILTPSNTMAYICKTPQLFGKFDIVKAAALNVPKGPLFGRLKLGHSVTLSDGSVVQPEQVLGQPELSRYVMIIGSMDDIDSSTSEQFEALLACALDRKEFSMFQDSQRSSRMDCIVHLSSYEVISCRSYQTWIRRFGDETSHIFAGRQSNHNIALTSFLAASLYAQKLHQIASNLITFMEVDDMEPTTALSLRSRHIIGKPLLKYHVKPIKAMPVEDILASSMISMNIELEEFKGRIRGDKVELTRKLQSIDDSKTQIMQWMLDHESYEYESTAIDAWDQLQLDDQRVSSFLRQKDVSIWFLGTACAIPSKYRNVSGILIDIASSDSYMLLETGEGTWQQLVRMSFHRQRSTASARTIDIGIITKEISRRLKLIWISHHHADHHLGLITIITERWRCLCKPSNGQAIDPQPITIIAPPSVLQFLEEYSQIHAWMRDAYIGVSIRLLDPYESTEARQLPEYDNPVDESLGSFGQSYGRKGRHRNINDNDMMTLQRAKEIWSSMNIEEISNVRVIHCPHAYGVSVSIKSQDNPSEPNHIEKGPFKIVYSGDTRPSLDLIHIGKDASVLIHEATFEDDMVADAEAKRHSTISEAMTVAKAMNSYRLILTHFSQRYRSVPSVPSQSRLNVVMAFDFMCVSMKDLLWAPLLTDVFSEAFPPEDDQEDVEENNQNEKDHRSGATSREETASIDTGKGIEAATTASHTPHELESQGDDIAKKKARIK